jgi:tRNA(fMet)-specific endonuclease VapC
VKYLLDTNTCIRYINGRAPNLRVKIPAIPSNDIAVCAVVKAEMFSGAMKSQTPERSLAKQRRFLRAFKSLPFDDAAAEHYAHIRSQLETKGTPIGPNDYMIAAIALANDLILVTHNVAEFSRVENLKIEDWEV